MISAKIVGDSKNKFGHRITSMVVTFPRFILAELNTHRMFSRNSASSRAIPFKKMVEMVEKNPFIPIAWQKEHTGMQGSEYFTDPDDIKLLTDVWLNGRNEAIQKAKLLSTLEVTKQLCNRQLEAYMWHTVLITATDFENFFALRCPQYEYMIGSKSTIHRSEKSIAEMKSIHHPWTTLEKLQNNKGQAEIHMMALAEAMWDAYNESTPKELKAGEWHIPFSDDLPSIGSEDEALKVATARCARVSYTVVGEEDKPTNYENDIKLHDRLAASGHWSPFEHCAQSMTDLEYYENVRGIIPTFKEEKGDIFNAETYCTGEYANTTIKDSYGWSGNFRGFIQYRKFFPNENITK